MSATKASNFGLSKAQRLRKPKDFQRVYQAKQWGHSADYSYNVLAVEAAATKLGVTVSKRVSKSAVDRNLIKRQIKEFYRLRQRDLVVNAELVITAKPSCAKASAQQRQQSLEVLWHKLLKWQHWFEKTQAKQSPVE